MPPAKVNQKDAWIETQPMFTAARSTFIVLTFTIMLDIGMMIVSILAYTGAHSDDDRAIIQRTKITFSTAGHHIQRAEIALPSLGLVAHPTLGIWLMIRARRLQRNVNYENGVKVSRFLSFILLPGLIVLLAGWILCVAFQASYVPVLHGHALPECAEFGDELTQCGMVTATWIISICYCAVYAAMLILAVLTFYHLTYPPATQQQSQKPLTSSFLHSRPPSYRTNASRPPSYHSEMSKKRGGLIGKMTTLRENDGETID